MPRHLEIRSAARDDRSSVAALLGELGYPVVDAVRFSAAYDELRGKGAILVAVADDIVGVVTIGVHLALRLGARVATIDELVVGANARGGGVGAALVEAAKVRARAMGAMSLELQTRRTRESYARGFYRKQGFVEAESAIFRADLTLATK